jgi:hypothetical protein
MFRKEVSYIFTTVLGGELIPTADARMNRNA